METAWLGIQTVVEAQSTGLQIEQSDMNSTLAIPGKAKL